jgi:5,5'-dehydrodivanillate O-demethylase
LFTGNHFEWRVPIDDERTLSVGWFFDRVPEEMEPFHQERIPYWYGPIKDEQTGRWIESHVMNQDFVAWVGQGRMADRTQEHLGESDRGIILMRKRLIEEAEKVKQGLEPKGIIRDPRAARFVELPIVGRDFFLAGYSLRDVADGTTSGLRYPRQFVFQAGQPEEITRDYRAAMGMDRVAALATT